MKTPSYTPLVARRNEGASKSEAAVSDQNEDSKTSKIVMKSRPPQ